MAADVAGRGLGGSSSAKGWKGVQLAMLKGWAAVALSRAGRQAAQPERKQVAEQLAACEATAHPSQAACACRCRRPHSPATGTRRPARQRLLQSAAAGLPWGLNR